MNDMKRIKKYRSRNKEKLREAETTKLLKNAENPKSQKRYRYNDE